MAMTFNGEGPIPGENYTSDTKNYPWHQPPEFTNVNKALDWVARKVGQPQAAHSIATLAEMGVPLWQISDMYVTQGIGEGKWTPDFAIMLAGPVTRMFEIICITLEVPYELDLDDELDIKTGNFFLNMDEIEKNSKGPAYKVLEQELPDIKDAVQTQKPGATSAPEEAPGGGQASDFNAGGFMASAVPLADSGPTEGAPEEESMNG